MIKVGHFNKLEVVKEVDFGVFLDGHEEGEILLPKRYKPEQCEVGDELEVFVFLDSEDRVIATTETPYVKVGEFASLKCIDVNEVGAFMDWGLGKDLFVPFGEQRAKLEVDKRYLVYVYIDKIDQRITATTKLDKYLSDASKGFSNNQEVEILIGNKTDLGIKTIVNSQCWGMLFNSDIEGETLPFGNKMKAYVKRVRPDGKLDLMLKQQGYAKLGPLAEAILSKLQANDGYMPVSDKSKPELIKRLFSCSKREFKMAIGSLYKQKKITITKEGITLV